MSKKSDFVPPVVYDAYGPKQPRQAQLFQGPSMTRQEFKDNGNLDVIVDRFTNGVPMPMDPREPLFEDVSRVPSYQEAQNVIIRANKAFEDLPLKVRKRLKTPAELMAFLADPENEAEARKLGLLKPSAPPAPSSSPSKETPSKAAPEAPEGASQGKGA